MAKVSRKSFEARCKYCKRKKTVELIGESKKLGVVWLRCTSCHHANSFSPERLRKDGTVTPIKSKSKQEIKQDEIGVIEYSPSNTYQVGQKLYHRTFDDVGRVAEKTKTSEDIGKILVDFERAGKKVLVEGF